MASPEDVKKLAALARIMVLEAELPKFVQEFDSILTYIGQLERLNIATGPNSAQPALRNVFREDSAPHAPGIHTKKLVDQFPERDENYLSVKQIISHD